MPEHLHLLVRPWDEAYETSRFLHAVKRPEAERMSGSLAEHRSPLLKKLTVAESGKPLARFWQGGGGYDLNPVRIHHPRNHNLRYGCLCFSN